LRHTDLHVSWASSVTIEAAQMGIRTALLNPLLQDPAHLGDYYVHYREKGLVDLVVPETSAIIDWIASNRNSRAGAESYAACDAEYDGLIDVLSGVCSHHDEHHSRH